MTGNQKMLIVNITCLRMLLSAKTRVETEMHPEEKNKLYNAIESLLELEDFYTAKEKTDDLLTIKKGDVNS